MRSKRHSSYWSSTKCALVHRKADDFEIVIWLQWRVLTAFRNPLEPYLDFEIIRGLEALLGSLSFLVPPGSDWDVCCPFAGSNNQSPTNKTLLVLR